MEINEIKKALYKEKPIANCYFKGKTTWLYDCQLGDNMQVFFKVPIEDMGTASFDDKMQAQFLIRWYNEYMLL